MASVRANDKVGVHLQFALRRLCAHADHTRTLHQQIHDFRFHAHLESWKPFRMTREKIEEIPLWHERDEFAARGKLRENCYRDASSCEQITGHHTSRPATHDYATCL